MGWSSGTRLFDAVIQAVRAHVPDVEVRERLYNDLIQAFEDFDWDNGDECLGEDPAYDAAYKSLHPEDG